MDECSASDPTHWAAHNSVPAALLVVSQLAAFRGVGESELLGAREGPLGRTPLHVSVEAGSVAVAQFLATRAPGTLSLPDARKTTPLHLSAGRGDAAITRILLEAGASVTSADMEGWLPLHCAAARGSAEVVRLLANSKALASVTNAQGRTPLHCAAHRGRTSTAQELLSLGAALDCQDKEGNTPLCLACASDRLPVIEMLLSAGADMATANARDEAPLALCRSDEARQLLEAERDRRERGQGAASRVARDPLVPPACVAGRGAGLPAPQAAAAAAAAFSQQGSSPSREQRPGSGASRSLDLYRGDAADAATAAVVAGNSSACRRLSADLLRPRAPVPKEDAA